MNNPERIRIRMPTPAELKSRFMEWNHVHASPENVKLKPSQKRRDEKLRNHRFDEIPFREEMSIYNLLAQKFL